MNENKYTAALVRSPMFQLSLSSKELFHSNFLYCIAQLCNGELFVKVIEHLLGISDIASKWGEKWVVKREHQNFDLCVVDTTNKVRFVLENKFKSIPYKKQLDGYIEKSPYAEHHVLLTLFEDFPEADKVKADGWLIVNYQQLSAALAAILNYTEGYTHALISDYKEFISNFHLLTVTWSDIDLNRNWADIKSGLADYNVLRIGDVYQKIRYSLMLMQIVSALKSDYQINNTQFKWRVNAEDIFNESEPSFYVNSGLTNKTGFLEIKVRIDRSTILLIQIQGDQYRRCAERNSGKLADNLKWIKSGAGNDIRKFFAINEDEIDVVFPFQSPDNFPFRNNNKSSDGQSQNGFCKYGDRFIYQYVTINPELKLADIVKAVCADVMAFAAIRQ